MNNQVITALLLATIAVALATPFLFEQYERWKVQAGYGLAFVLGIATLVQSVGGISSLASYGGFSIFSQFKGTYEEVLDHKKLPTVDRIVNSATAHKNIKNQIGNRTITRAVLVGALVRTFRIPLILGASFKLGAILTDLAAIEIDRRLVKSATELDIDGIRRLLLFKIVAKLLGTYSSNASSHYQVTLQKGVTSSLLPLVYAKSVRSRSSINLVIATSEYVEQVVSGVMRFFLSLEAFAQFAFLTPSLFKILGKAVWLALAIIFLALWVRSRFQGAQYFSDMIEADNRQTEFLLQALSNVKSVKLNGWEASIAGRMDYFYDKFNYPLLKAQWKQFISMVAVYNICSSAGATLGFVLSAILSGNSFNAAALYSAIAIFKAIGGAATQVTSFSDYYYQTVLGVDKLVEILTLPEDGPVEKTATGVSVSSETTFKVGDHSLNYDLEASNECVAIIGKTGSGKSCIVRALVGELEIWDGPLPSIQTPLAYCPQDPWIISDSVRENILLESNYDEKWYLKVLEACALDKEFGLDTNRGEVSSISLSGGQKARVALARALYSKADVYVFDDILSAIDQTVTKHILNRLFGNGGLLVGKTVVFATNNGAHVPPGSQVLHVERVEDRFIVTKQSSIECTKTSLTGSSSTALGPVQHSQLDEKPTPDPHLDDSDSTSEQETSFTVKDWIRITGGPTSLLFVTTTIGGLLLNVAGEMAIGKLTEQQNNDRDSIIRFCKLYTLYSLIPMCVKMARSTVRLLFLTSAMNKNSTRQSLLSLLHAPVSFLSKTPSGEIVNRLRMLSENAEGLAESFGYLVEDAMKLLSGFYLLSFSNPWVLSVVLPLLYVQLRMVDGNPGLRNNASILYEKDNNARVSLIESLQNGRSIICGLERGDEFLQKLYLSTDKESRSSIFLASLQSQTAARSDLLSTVFETIVTVSTLYSLRKGTASAAALGIVLSTCREALSTAKYFSGDISDVQSSSSSLARNEFRLASKSRRVSRKPPTSGAIEFRNVSARYPQSSQYALSNISFSLAAGERVGIAGRTGAGKSSLVGAIFGLLDVEKGKILVDGRDVSSIDPAALRSAFAIIPQDPLVLLDTVRFNLDPQSSYLDEDLLQVLEIVKLDEKILGFGMGLETLVGANTFSKGERQLLCLARTLLKKPALLVLDEATGSVDTETETIARESIKRHLAGVTVLDITHRSDVLKDCDRVLTLAEGMLLE